MKAQALIQGLQKILTRPAAFFSFKYQNPKMES
jgi:hypothetical protein